MMTVLTAAEAEAIIPAAEVIIPAAEVIIPAVAAEAVIRTPADTFKKTACCIRKGAACFFVPESVNVSAVWYDGRDII